MVLAVGVFSSALANHHQSPDNTPPEGFRSLFDGKMLDGWKPMPRLPVLKYPGAPFNVDPKRERMQTAQKNVGKWTVVDGMSLWKYTTTAAMTRKVQEHNAGSGAMTPLGRDHHKEC